jgi:flagellar motor switch protein FliN
MTNGSQAATAASLDELGPGTSAGAGTQLDSLLDMSLPVSIEFGRTTMTMQEVLDLGPGSVVQLDRMVGEPVDIFVSDRRLAEGEIVVVGEQFGVRITRILNTTKDGR